MSDRATALSLAVEEPTVREGDSDLLNHDRFIRDNIRAEDTLIVLIGANDIVLKPPFTTVRHMLPLAWLTPRKELRGL